MSKKRVKNISGIDQAVVGVGLIKADEIVEVDETFNNANFEIVKSKSEERRINETKKEEKVETPKAEETKEE